MTYADASFLIENDHRIRDT